MVKVKLVVNGEARDADVPDPAMPLLFVLRDLLGLTGTKIGCMEAVCGACTVLVDGVAVRSCQTPVGDLGEAAVTTIEGLSENGDHPLQRAFVEGDVPQCGYCQSGQIMSAVALLRENARPDDAAIDAAMAGNICRCGTYNRIRAAIKDAARAIA